MGKYSHIAAAARAGSMRPEEAAGRAFDVRVFARRCPGLDVVGGTAGVKGGALASALLTATEMPIHTLQPYVGDLATQLVALGIRQTEHVDPEALNVPAWITDGVRQHSVQLPAQPEPTVAEPVVERVAVAPKCPKRIAKRARAGRG